MPGCGPVRFTPFPVGGWRDDAECSRHERPELWDDAVDLPGARREAPAARQLRHRQAVAICRLHCPVRDECAAEVDSRLDEGVRAGHLLPPLHARFGQGTRYQVLLAGLLARGVPLDEAVAHAVRKTGQ